MIDLARHASVILKQIRFVARHSVCEMRSEDGQSIAAMRQIAAELRRSAGTIAAEAKHKEESARAHADRNAILYQERGSGVRS